eukprot:TRINITY_DN9570_c0_g1_i3.p1 TRINITY_DN9570_c0_g1~~TRINITY_DN9570_c0_g1_i3.p1  ORF type:complete len:397 (+),score=94.45 TRINITY_DN9570_c0_g1_i3:29-1192(+)
MSALSTSGDGSNVNSSSSNNAVGGEDPGSPQTVQRRGAFIGRDRGDKRLSVASPIGGYRNASRDAVPPLSLLNLPEHPATTQLGSTSPRMDHANPPLLKSPRTLELMSLMGSGTTSPILPQAAPPKSDVSRRSVVVNSTGGSGGTFSRVAGMGALATGSVVQTVGAGGNTSYEAKIEDEIAIGNLTAKSENRICADCSSPNPRCVSVTFGVWVCGRCAKLMNELIGNQTANLKNLDLGWHYFGPESVKMLEHIGNAVANDKLEHKINTPKPNPNSDNEVRMAWLRKKYEEMENVKGFEGVVMMGTATTVNVVSGSSSKLKKKKILFERKFFRIQGSVIHIYNKEDDPEPIETVELILCGYKEYQDIDFSSISTVSYTHLTLPTILRV